MIRKNKVQKPEKPNYCLLKKWFSDFALKLDPTKLNTHTHKKEKKTQDNNSQLMAIQGMEKIAMTKITWGHNVISCDSSVLDSFDKTVHLIREYSASSLCRAIIWF